MLAPISTRTPTRSRLLTALPLLAGLFFATAAQAETYQFSGTPYVAGNITNYSACATGACANYVAGQAVSGQFTTSGPLAANLSDAEIYPQVTSFQFTDGLSSFGSTTPGIRPYIFHITTNATGQITASNIILLAWQDGLSGPHSVGDRLNVIAVSNLTGQFIHNGRCNGGLGSGGSLSPDICFSPTTDSASSTVHAGGGSWSLQTALPQGVPTLSTWALGLLSLVLAGITVRRRRA